MKVFAAISTSCAAFFPVGQFIGFAGSSGPSQSTFSCATTFSPFCPFSPFSPICPFSTSASTPLEAAISATEPQTKPNQSDRSTPDSWPTPIYTRSHKR